MAAAKPMKIGCDQNLYLRNVRDIAGEVLTGATVNYTIMSKYLVDDEYQEVDSGVLPEVSSGNYEKIIDASITAEVVEGRHYYVTYTYTDTDGNDATIRQEYYGTYAS